jgi:glucans biosynthesis protein
VFNYRLFWGDNVPAAWSGARVAKTRTGNGKKDGNVLFVLDLTGPSVKDAKDVPLADVSASAGRISNVVVQRNREIGGIRVTFELTPGNADLVELRCLLKAGDQPISETWLYRWTKP